VTVAAGADAPSRRDRLRAATKDEIIQTARRLLVRDGPGSVTLRAIAREMGMTAPGLYRYFGSHEELVRHVIADIFTELGTGISRALDEVPDCDQPTVKLTHAMAAACHEFRHWALSHKDEFALTFGAPLPGIDNRNDIADECALQLGGIFFTLFLELWEKARFAVPDPDQIDPGLREQLTRYGNALGADVPASAMLTFLRCWMLLYGAVSMEVFGHLGFALIDPAPMFEITVSEMARLVGLRYPLLSALPRPARRS
jgi:AcrR family transcriptional regulator